MSKFKKLETGIDGLYVIEPTVFGDQRGFFMETYNQQEFQSIGLTMAFVQDNHSKSMRGVLRGLHFQTKHPQGKLVRVTKGSVWDVAVDLRPNSTTFGRWYGLLLSAGNRRMFYIPEGFAHGFLTLENETEFMYKCTDFYYPEYDAGIIYNDEELAIEWPMGEYALEKKDIILSEKDSHLPTLREYLAQSREKDR